MPKRSGKQIRVEFRKKREIRTRQEADLTRDFEGAAEEIDTPSAQRISGKGRDTRRRTVVGESTQSAASTPDGDVGNVRLSIGDATAGQNFLQGQVLRVHRLECIVLGADGREYRCAIRRLLKSLATDQRHVVVAGDLVTFRIDSETALSATSSTTATQQPQQGLIVRVEPRRGTLSRTSRNRRHVIVANVDQIMIVTSAAEPTIKPNLIDRFLITAEQNHLDACIVINKCDLIDPAELQPLIGSYAQMGHRVEMVSATRGWGMERLKSMMRGRQSVVVGQSGVGKSSILNAIEPGLMQRVQQVSAENQKGKHTTTTAQVFPLSLGGDVRSSLIDTPGIRQFQLYDISPTEIAGLFRDLRPFASLCKYPNCTHLHESDCAVKDALADYRISVRRYDSYCQMVEDPGE
jgi:ribosome biogenesis GTPase / thiamine phosphate phosphatase